jgi:hypothetical protein
MGLASHALRRQMATRRFDGRGLQVDGILPGSGKELNVLVAQAAAECRRQARNKGTDKHR